MALIMWPLPGVNDCTQMQLPISHSAFSATRRLVAGPEFVVPNLPTLSAPANTSVCSQATIRKQQTYAGKLQNMTKPQLVSFDSA